MDTQTKSPVEIVQEFIALHTTRKEALERLNSNQLLENSAGRNAAAGPQSDAFISELMEELSNYGDAVMASVDRENEYQGIWTQALGTLDTMTPVEGAKTFQAMEDRLKQQYQHTLETEMSLPDSLQAILKRQASQL